MKSLQFFWILSGRPLSALFDASLFDLQSRILCGSFFVRVYLCPPIAGRDALRGQNAGIWMWRPGNFRGAMAGMKINEDNTVKLAERFAKSDKFRSLFRDGMRLVEESATFLDGPGRTAAKALARETATIYGAESMRLTTRLMQLASWLLLQRAASDGEMTRTQILEERKKVRLDSLPVMSPGPDWQALPGEFVALVERSAALQNRVVTLDADMYGRPLLPDAHSANPVDQQIELLSTALGAMRNR
jgi:regulator of CtrA degradation